MGRNPKAKPFNAEERSKQREDEEIKKLNQKQNLTTEDTE